MLSPVTGTAPMARLLLILAICVGIFQSVRSFEREGKGALEMRTTKYGIPYKIDFEDEELRRLKKSFCRSIEDLRFYDTERNVAFEDVCNWKEKPFLCLSPSLPVCLLKRNFLNVYPNPI